MSEKPKNYTLPCAHTHAGKRYEAGETIKLRKDQIQRIEARLAPENATTETGGND